MSEIQINTTQNVNINFTLASVGERILAFLLDLIIKFAYGYFVYWVFMSIFGKMYESLDYWSQIALIALIFLPAIFYTLVLESFLEGQTIGKKALKIRVVKIDGYQATFSDHVIRWIFRIVDLNMFIGFIALVSIIVTRRAQRLGDVAAGTSVISIKNRIGISHTILADIGDDYKPTYPTVIKLSDNDMRIIKETFLTAQKSGDIKTQIKLRRKVEEVIGEESKDQNITKFINTIIKDYNYYTQNM